MTVGAIDCDYCDLCCICGVKKKRLHLKLKAGDGVSR